MQHARIVDIVLEDTLQQHFLAAMMMMMGGGTGILQLPSYLQAHAACSDGRDHSG